MLPLCLGRYLVFVREILQMTAWFGTEGSVVQIHSPRPIPSKILGNLQNLTSRLARLEAINCASGTECSVLLTVHLGGIVRDVASWAIAADASRAAAGSNPYASLLGYATWMLFLVWERLASRETRILYAVVMDDLLALAIFSRWRIWETAMRSCATCARSPSVSRTFDVSLRSPPLHSCRCC
jgi:hypothetical protein